MNDPAASSGVSSSLLGRHSVPDTACPVLDTGESSRVFWIPAFAGMTNSPRTAGNTTLREFNAPENGLRFDVAPVAQNGFDHLDQHVIREIVRL